MDPIDALSEDELREGFRRFVAMTMRLGDVGNGESRALIVRLLTSQDPADPLPDLPAMVERALDERDLLRSRVEAAAARLERLGGGATLMILRGEG